MPALATTPYKPQARRQVLSCRGMIPLTRRLALIFIFLFAVPWVSARVTRVEITSRADVLNAQSFGDSCPYERITGRVYFSVPIANVHNQAIVDLPNAVNLQNGEVEFSADFVAVRPKMPPRETARCCWKIPTAVTLASSR